MVTFAYPDLVTFNKYWSAWEPLTKDERTKLNEDFDKLKVNDEGEGIKNDEGPSLAQRDALQIRLDLYKDIVNLYASDSDDKDRFQKLMGELKAPNMRQFDLALRIKRAGDGKEAASKKYNDGNWFGALYTYTVAWGCLVPYYPEAIKDDKLRSDMEKLEYQLFSNIAAMVASGMKTKEITDKAQRKKLLELGIRTCILVASMQEIVTVGVMVKTCRRATDIHTYYTQTFSNSPPLLSRAKLDYFRRQCEVLSAAPGDKLFKDQPKEKKLKVPEDGPSGSSSF